jgi:energy-coupling factor transport system substrate-specific component
MRQTRPVALPLSSTGRILMLGVTILGVAALFWPFLIHASSTAAQAHRSDAPIELLVLVPLMLVLCASEVARGNLDARGIAVLGILAACGTALRIPSPGVAGFEPMFFLLVLAGRVYGVGFGFALGGLTMLVSSIATGGVGPWLPFQMLAAGWVGAGAGLLPRASGWTERGVLASYTAVACLLYGSAMNLWFWPFGAGTSTSVSYIPGAPVLENARHFLVFDITTSLGFDIPRAVINSTLVLVVGAPVLAALRRSARRSALLDPLPTFADTSDGGTATSSTPTSG